MARIFRTGIALGVVLASYMVYARAVVPLIEPSARRYDSGPRRSSGAGSIARVNELDGLFPVGAWELDEKRTKKLQSDQVTLLLQDYQTLDDGKVTIHPCTMLFLPDASVTDPAERKRRTVVLQTPGGAELEFDEPLELGLSRFGGRLVGGRLIGAVRIRSGMKLPGPEDDLMILARDVKITQQLVTTPNPVSFRLGPHHGRGGGMSIKLLADDKDRDSDSSGSGLAGIEWFEIRQVEKLLIIAEDDDDDDVVDGGGAGQAADSGLPIEVTCDGPFRFDAIAQEATFSDNVNVLCLRPEGPARIECAQLTIEFARRRDDLPSPSQSPPTTTAAAKRKPRNTFDLQPRRIVARGAAGAPVNVSAPDEGVTAQGEWLIYDLQEEQISLSGGSEVFLRQDSNEIHARVLQYKLAAKGRIGQVRAEGPGWLFARTSRDSDRPLHASWKGLLQVYPDQGEQLISLGGGAVLDLRGFGRLSADQISFWMFESLPDGRDPTDRKVQLSPDRMLAVGQVRLESPGLSTNVQRPINRLEIWFKQQRPAVAAGPPVPEASAAGLAPTSGQHQAKPPKRHFNVAGDLVRAEVLIRDGEDSELSELTIEGDVRVVETRTARPDERPMLIRGDQIYVVNANTPRATATMIGRPAHFEARGFSLEGTNIRLDQGANLLSINGAGRMGLPVTKDLQRRPLDPPGVMTIDWQRRMEFNGQIAAFDESVVADGPGQHLETTRLEVTLVERIDFADADLDLDGAADREDRLDPEIARIDCHGAVFMENREYDEQFYPKALTRALVANLGLNVVTGEATADGPGRITTVRRGGNDDPLGLRSRNASQADSPDEDGDREDRLDYLDVRFQGPLVGFSLPYRATFHDQVHCVYGPVNAWDEVVDPNDPSFAESGGAQLHCDQLSVDDARRTDEDEPVVNLLASGNVLAEGRGYLARASRMTYAQAKDQLILEGTGWASAELHRLNSSGSTSPRIAAQKIIFWPETMDFRIIGARAAELSSLSPE